MSSPQSSPDMYIDTSKELHETDVFNFACTPEKSCFTHCCYDLSLILTPYDIYRLKKRMEMDSDTFLKKYTAVHVGSESGIPVVMVNIEKETYKCPFLDENKGCTVYEDRPGACRTYPLARITYKKDDMTIGDYYYIVKESDCTGHKDPKPWTVGDWINHEGLREYNHFNDFFAEVLEARKKSGIIHLHADQINDFYMACYNIDDFRRFFLEGPNLDRMMEDQTVIDTISNDDMELIKYAFNWAKRKIFGGCPSCPIAGCGK